MELSVALIVFLLKTGIKQLDKDYNINSFIEDILNAFGEKAGNKLCNIIKKSHYEINNILKDQNLSILGVDTTRTSMVRANAIEILKQVKISNTMLIDHNCNAEEITQFIITNYANNTIRSDDIALRDIRLVLFEIIKIHIDIATQDSAFITEILNGIYGYLKMNPTILKNVEEINGNVKEINSDVKEMKDYISIMMAYIKENSSKHDNTQELFFSLRARQNDEPDHWTPNKSETRERTDSKTLEGIVDISKGGQGNVTLV